MSEFQERDISILSLKKSTSYLRLSIDIFIELDLTKEET